MPSCVTSEVTGEVTGDIVPDRRHRVDRIVTMWARPRSGG